MPLELNRSDAGFEAAFTGLLAAKRETQEDVQNAVAAILADVRARGDAALLEYTARFDRVTLTVETMRVTAEEIDRALASIEPSLLEALKLAAERIEDFHRRQTPDALSYTDAAGVRLGARWTAVGSVGLYVPGGTAAYPSSVLMNALPAKVAGVERVTMVVPTPDGKLNPLVLAAARIAGVHEIYRIGGAQAVGALAYGTETIRPVDKIVGPGNAYVAAAKRHVFGTVGIDMIAGPSEILVVADGANDPAWIAADLLSQAEHDTSAQSILITDDAGFAEAVKAAVEGHLKTLPRAEIAGASWRDHGAVIVVSHLDEAVPLVDRLAPEHLELAVADPDALAARIRNAGAIFLGRHTPEAIGDYIAGPNHVLPTARSARFSSGLNLLDFMKRTTLVGCDPGSLGAIGPAAVALAEAEGLGAHALSVSIRLNGAPQVTTQPPNENHRIIHVALDERSVVRRAAEVEHERAVAIFDLLDDNLFRPEECPDAGPFRLHLSMEDNRMLFDIRNAENSDLTKVLLPLTPFRSIVRDYFMICDSYYKAIKKATPSQIEAIDMGRRGLHNEGSELLRERLAGKVEVDHNTARRLFTLICILHIRG